MKKLNRTRIIKRSLSAFIIGVSLYVFATAPRRVSIPALASSSSGSSSEGVSLYNGSASTVYYKITCYNKNGGINFGPIDHNLSAKTKAQHGASPMCSSGTVATLGSLSNGMVMCDSSSVPTATNCPADFHLCTYNEMQANANNDGSLGWVDASTFTFTVSGTWSVGTTSNSSTSYQDYNASSYGYGPAPQAKATSTCYTSTQGSGSSQAYCGAAYLDSNGSPYSLQNFCCPNAGAEIPSSACDVEILSTTPADGFLQSPQFKSNAPF